MNAVQKWLSETEYVKRTCALDAYLAAAETHASLAKAFSLRKEAQATHVDLHRRGIDLFNAHKPWYLRKRKYSL